MQLQYSPASSSPSSSDSESTSSFSSPSTSRSPPVHAASLVGPQKPSPELMQLLDIKLTRPVIEYIVDCIYETVDFAMGRSSSSQSRGRSAARCPSRTKFTAFVSTVLSRAEVTLPTILVTLVYIARARPHLCITLEVWALERVFLGALIVASKYTHDSSLKNAHWALCTGVFGIRDIGRIEREFLDVLAWELGVREADLVAHHEGLVAAAEAGARRNHRRSYRSTSRSASPHPPPGYLHLPRGHAHRPQRRSSTPVVPELSPSSPHSSYASMSPRTPVYLDVPMDVVPAKSNGKLDDLLHAFPLPPAWSFPTHITA